MTSLRVFLAEKGVDLASGFHIRYLPHFCDPGTKAAFLVIKDNDDTGESSKFQSKSATLVETLDNELSYINNVSIYEVQTVSRVNEGSLFIDNTVVASDKLFVTTQIDPLFLLLPHLIPTIAEDGTSKMQELNVLLEDDFLQKLATKKRKTKIGGSNSSSSDSSGSGAKDSSTTSSTGEMSSSAGVAVSTPAPGVASSIAHLVGSWYTEDDSEDKEGSKDKESGKKGDKERDEDDPSAETILDRVCERQVVMDRVLAKLDMVKLRDWLARKWKNIYNNLSSNQIFLRECCFRNSTTDANAFSVDKVKAANLATELLSGYLCPTHRKLLASMSADLARGGNGSAGSSAIGSSFSSTNHSSAIDSSILRKAPVIDTHLQQQKKFFERVPSPQKKKPVPKKPEPVVRKDPGQLTIFELMARSKAKEEEKKK